MPPVVGIIDRQQKAKYWPDPKSSHTVFFSADYLSLGSTERYPGLCGYVTFEQF